MPENKVGIPNQPARGMSRQILDRRFGATAVIPTGLGHRSAQAILQIFFVVTPFKTRGWTGAGLDHLGRFDRQLKYKIVGDVFCTPHRQIVKPNRTLPTPKPLDQGPGLPPVTRCSTTYDKQA